jgi:DHA1 family tetracycline resistance protein-like MFS transporter
MGMSEKPAQQGALYVLLLTVFIDMAGFGIIIPFMPFWAEHFDASPVMVTLLFSTYSGVALFASFVWGWISDRWGRKPVLLLSLMGSVMSFAWLGLADALWMLFAARALGGLFGANIAVAQAYIADITPPERRAQGMGMMGAAFGLGFVLGPAIGGALAGPDAANPDFRTPFFAAAAVSLTGVVVGLVFLPEPARHAAARASPGVANRLRGFALAMAHPGVALPIAVALSLAFVMAGMESTYALWTERVHQWGPRQTGYFFAYIGVLLVLIQGGLVRVAASRLGEARTVPIAVAAMMLGIGMVPWCLTVPLLLVSGFLIALGFGLGNPSLNSLVSRNAPANIQGAVLGASQSGQSLCRIVGPISAGALFQGFGRDIPFYAGGIVLIAAAALAFGVVRRVEPGLGRGAAGEPGE